MTVATRPGRVLYRRQGGIAVPVGGGDPLSARDQAQVDFILSCTNGSEGWIAAAPDRAAIRPYMAHYAALGLLAAAARYPADPQATDWLTAVSDWAVWYGDHVEGDGFVRDYGISHVPTAFTDDFERSDRDLDGDNGWVSTVGLWAIADGTAYCVTTQGYADSKGVLGRDYGTADVIIETTVPAVVNNNDGIAFRITGSGMTASWWLVRYDRVLRYTGGGANAFQQTGYPAFNFAPGDLMRVECEGDQIRVYGNGVLRKTITDTNNQDATIHGLATGTAGTTWAWEDISMTPFGTPGATVVTSLGPDSMDSTDAYAGLWLVVLARLATATGSAAFIDWAQVELVLDGVESTMQPDGLTWAKPSFEAKYLEDNQECIIGLRSIVSTATAAGQTAVAAHADDLADRMALGLAAMWNEQDLSWDWAISGSGVRVQSIWDLFASEGESSLRQHVWSVAWGLTPSEMRDPHMVRYLTAWDDETLDWASGDPSYEPMTAIALQAAEYFLDASSGMDRLYAAGEALGFAWPWTCNTAGLVLAYPDWEPMDLGLPAGMRNMPQLIPDATWTTSLAEEAFGVPRGWNTYFTGTTVATITADGTNLVTDAVAVVYGARAFVIAGRWYTFSMLVEAEALGGGDKFIMKIEWLNMADALVDYGYVLFGATPGVETLRHISLIAPATAITALVSFGIDGGGGDVWVRQVQVENAGAPTDRSDDPPWPGSRLPPRIAGTYATQAPGWEVIDLTGAVNDGDDEWGVGHAWINHPAGGSIGASGGWAAAGGDGTLVRTNGSLSGTWPGGTFDVGLGTTHWFGFDVLRRIVLTKDGVTVIDFTADWPLVHP